MSWSNKEGDQAAISNDRVGAKSEQLEDLIIRLRIFEQVSVTAVLSSVEIIVLQVENRVVRFANCDGEGGVGRELLMSAVTCMTVLPTSLVTPAFVFCKSIIA